MCVNPDGTLCQRSYEVPAGTVPPEWERQEIERRVREMDQSGKPAHGMTTVEIGGVTKTVPKWQALDLLKREIERLDAQQSK